MIARPTHHATRILGWTLLIVLLLLPALLGSLSSIIAVLLAALLLPLYLVRDVRAALRLEPAIWIFPAAFVALLAAYTITARDPGNLVYIVSFLALPLCLAAFALARRHAGPGLVRLVAALCCAGAIIAALVAANDVFLRGLTRATGFLMGGNLLARVAVLLGFLGLAGLFVTRSPWRLALYLGPLAGLVVTLLTGTRGAALGLPAFGVILAAILFADRRDRRQLLALGAMVVVAGIALTLSGRFAGLVSVVSDVLSSGVSSTDNATNERLGMFQAAFEAFKLSPWVGYGWANLAPAAALTMDMTPHGGGGPGGSFQFHSDIANFAVAAGLVGLVAWLGLLLAPLAGALSGPHDRLFRARLYACVILSIGMLIFGFTDLNFGYDLPTTLYAYLAALVLGGFRKA